MLSLQSVGQQGRGGGKVIKEGEIEAELVKIQGA